MSSSLHHIWNAHDYEFLQTNYPDIHQKMQTLLAIGIHPECLEAFQEFQARISRTLRKNRRLSYFINN